MHQQDGGDNITYTIVSDQGPMVMVHGKKYPITSKSLTRSIGFHFRQGIEDLVRQIRMEAFPRLVSEYESIAGATINKTFLQADCQPSCQHLSAGSQPDPATDAFTLNWSTTPAKLYANPPWSLVGRVLSQILDQKVHKLILVRSSSVEGTTMLLQRTTSNPTIIEGNPASIPEQPSRHHTSINCVGCLRNRYQSTYLSEASTDLILSSL